MSFKISLVAGLAVVLSGCAANSKVVNSVDGLYQCNGNGSFFDLVGTGAMDAEQKCYEMATAHCGQIGKRPELVSMSSTNAMTTDVARAEAKFQCVSDSDITARNTAAAEDAVKKDLTVCKSYGFTQGSEAFANCLMTQDQNRINANARQVDKVDALQRQRLEDERRAGERTVEAATSLLPAKPVTCRSIGNVTTCQ